MGISVLLEYFFTPNIFCHKKNLHFPNITDISMSTIKADFVAKPFTERKISVIIKESNSTANESKRQFNRSIIYYLNIVPIVNDSF